MFSKMQQTYGVLKHDPEAKYSGYYKHSGYKLDVTLDAETGIPLCYIPMEITCDEGQNLVPSQKQLVDLGLCEEGTSCR